MTLTLSLKVKSNGAVGLPIYDFLLVFNNNHMSFCNCLGVIIISHSKNVLLSLIIRAKFWTPHTHPYPGAIFFKIEWFPPWAREKAATKVKLIGLIFF